jgi:HK97 family phage portal protein
MGKTKVSHQADSLGKSAAINEFTNKYFSKGLFLGAVIQYPVGSGISQEDAGALENTMRQVYGGVDKSGQVAVLTEGGELKQLKTDIPLGDTKYIESEAMTKRDIRAMFGIPDDMTTEAGVTEYYQNAIMPIIRQIEEEINAKVINPLDQKEIYFKFEVDSTLRADVRTRADVLEKYLRNSLMTINEGRTLLNLAPIEGGDVPMVMANNMVPLQQLEDFVNSKIN